MELFKLEKDKLVNSTYLLRSEKWSQKMQWAGWFWSSSRNGDFPLERERLLSKFSENPTFRILLDKKTSCSTRRGLRVGSGFREFPQTPGGRGFSLLGFYFLFKYFVNV